LRIVVDPSADPQKCVAAVMKRARRSTIEMTLSELSLFVEGSEAIGRMALSPPLLTKADLRSKFPEATR
jgi:hypothetical protein